MINSEIGPGGPDDKHKDLSRILREGPSGAIALAGIATLIVIAIWFAFYLFVFVPRGPLY